jgi:hypothetical protein
LINRRDTSTRYAKDYEFSRETVNELWAAGLDDARRVVADPQTLVRIEVSESASVYDLMRGPPEEVRGTGVANDQATILAPREPKGALQKLLHRWRAKLPSRKKSSQCRAENSQS